MKRSLAIIALLIPLYGISQDHKEHLYFQVGLTGHLPLINLGDPQLISNYPITVNADAQMAGISPIIEFGYKSLNQKLRIGFLYSLRYEHIYYDYTTITSTNPRSVNGLLTDFGIIASRRICEWENPLWLSLGALGYNEGSECFHFSNTSLPPGVPVYRESNSDFVNYFLRLSWEYSPASLGLQLGYTDVSNYQRVQQFLLMSISFQYQIQAK